ncbi:MAG: single-stranded DNA-binding protein [Sandaracinus sp.]|nr:single-stranded DNA-binding protein [Sandaracinus sp.]|tara:strand:+ start:569 stop:1291 length:723 start_codon:yes stop_codon:yes gene_type:complete
MAPRSKLSAIADRLSDRLAELSFAEPVTHVYDPTRYARAAHHDYLKRFGRGRKEVVFLGMNPGPWGMAQTGVPFGEVSYARDWMGVKGRIGKPEVEHPKRPIEGFECARSEVSGRRLWGWAEQRFGTAEAFFERFYVANYCPLVFMEESARNRVPEKLPVAERQPLLDACDEALVEVIEALQPELVVGVGAWARKRAEAALGDLGVRIGQVLHPSPASPRANRGWQEQAEAELEALGVRF